MTRCMGSRSRLQWKGRSSLDSPVQQIADRQQQGNPIPHHPHHPPKIPPRQRRRPPRRKDPTPFSPQMAQDLQPPLRQRRNLLQNQIRRPRLHNHTARRKRNQKRPRHLHLQHLRRGLQKHNRNLRRHIRLHPLACCLNGTHALQTTSPNLHRTNPRLQSGTRPLPSDPNP